MILSYCRSESEPILEEGNYVSFDEDEVTEVSEDTEKDEEGSEEDQSHFRLCETFLDFTVNSKFLINCFIYVVARKTGTLRLQKTCFMANEALRPLQSPL